MNIFTLIATASWLVKLVLLILLVFSFVSWVIIVRKHAQLKETLIHTDGFEQRFWSCDDLTQLFREVSTPSQECAGMATIFKSGFREFVRNRQQHQQPSQPVIESSERVMQVAVTREIGVLERHLEFLANVGSISPYIGLFGTVWGIMGAFQGLGQIKNVTIAVVAPHIAEALIATAMGLFAAIPAQWAYNHYARKIEHVASRYELFQEEFAALLLRQFQADVEPAE